MMHNPLTPLGEAVIAIVLCLCVVTILMVLL
jgi:hypothetical protein